MAGNFLNAKALESATFTASRGGPDIKSAITFTVKRHKMQFSLVENNKNNRINN
jgi:hypothetical protein